ncbi:hypothetical protein APSETT444_003620 [Aspergillus pseudonomiae]
MANEIPHSAYDEANNPSDRELDLLWETITEILSNARELSLFQQDENAWCSQVLDIYDALVRAGAGGALSQTMDSSMKRRLLFSGLEVKNENGGKDEALAQLATWIAAGMENTRKLWGQSSEEERPYCDLPPMVGWTVVGHDWHTWVTFGATKNGTDRLVRNSLPTLSKLS